MLYFWNMDVSSAFLPLLAQTEVCLRNRIVARLEAEYGDAWWDALHFQDQLGSRGKGIVLRAANDLRKSQKIVTTGRMTAALSFGFWANMLLPKYAEPLWHNFPLCFPDAPSGSSQPNLYELVKRNQELRNRITHHEPILGRDLSKDFSEARKLLSWMAPEVEIWMRPKLRVAVLLRQRP